MNQAKNLPKRQKPEGCKEPKKPLKSIPAKF